MSITLELLTNFNYYSALPGIVYFIFFQRKWSAISGIVFYILLASFLADNFSYVYAKYIYKNTYPIINAWYVINFLLVTYYFILVLKDRKKIIGSIFGLFVVICITSFLFIYPLTKSNTVALTFANTGIILFCLLSYMEMLRNTAYKLTKYPVFWITTSFLLFSTMVLLSTLFLQFLVFELKAGLESSYLVYTTFPIANIIKNLMLFYALVLIDKGHPDTIKPVKTK